jgi:hypothetical protein
VGVRGFINERTRPTAHREHRQQVRSHSVPESSTGVVRQGLLPQDARFSANAELSRQSVHPAPHRSGGRRDAKTRGD